ncbi:CvpA family protein [Nevskia sp.]|uniref:CvpA family protein n=1 Tax=Nevskia sp. TaxID=1929292 RepID=UPI0025FE556A|nr:CvpA family protein [Nevskia sp.]
MNWVDYAFIGIVVFSLLLGIWRGLVREAISLIALIAAFLLTGLYAPEVAIWLDSAIDSPLARGVTAHILVFVAVLLAGAFVTWLISKVVNAAGLSGFNRMLGGAFGALRGLLIITAIVLLAKVSVLGREPALRASLLRPSLAPLADTLHGLIPPAWLAWLDDDGDARFKKRDATPRESTPET